jgi:hypothetical protein
MDINKQIQEISDKVIAEKLPAMVEKSATDMLASIISDLFSQYGPMAKKIKEKIEEKLDVNLQKYDLLDYNALVAKTINDNLLQQINIAPILALTKDMLGFVNKKTIKLSEIIDIFIETAMEDSSESSGQISLFVEEEDRYGWIEVCVDAEARREKKDCSIRFLINKKTGTMFSFHCKDYLTSRQAITPSKLTNLSHIEHKIFRLYSAQVEIEIDELSFNTEWNKFD